MELEELCTPVKVVCPSCFQQLVGFKDETGAVKLRCPKCSAFIVSKYRKSTHMLNISVDLKKVK